MKELNYRLIVSDFDGTLANSRNQVTERVIDAVNGYTQSGGVFAVCTGRILPCILPCVRNMGLSGLVIASQGCQIADIATGKIIKNAGFSAQEAAEICAYLEELGVNIQLYSDTGFYSTLPEGEEHLALYEKIVGLKASHSDVPLSRLALRGDCVFCKAAVLVAPQDRQQLFDGLYSRFNAKFDVTCSAKVLVEISPLGETKGGALAFVAERYGIPLGKTVAVGDNLNDISMVQTAGLGVAVANGEEELKAVAGYIAPSCDEDAVAVVIEKFGYKND